MDGSETGRRDEITAVAEALSKANWGADSRLWEFDVDNWRALAEALLPWLSERAVAAEQAGREDNEDHGMCYVSGSKALAEREQKAAVDALRSIRRLAVRAYPKGMVPTSQVIADIAEAIDRIERGE